MKISLIIPVYNVEPYLRDCLDSIVYQTYHDFEVILIDDGSTDSSGILCDDYVTKYPNFKVRHQENSGVSVARNKGLELANGEYVIFVDSDDFLEPTFLETVIYEMKGFDLLFYGDIYHYQDGNIQTHQPFPSELNDRKSIENRILAFKRSDDGYEYYGFTWNKVFRMDIIKQYSIRFIEGLCLREDELFTTEYCQHINSIKVISEPIYHYRVLNTGLSSKVKIAEVIEKYCDALDKVSTSWSTKELYEYERFRYVYFLFQAYHIAHSYATKWRIAHKIHNVYLHESNSLLNHCWYFELPNCLFQICLMVKLCMGK